MSHRYESVRQSAVSWWQKTPLHCRRSDTQITPSYSVMICRGVTSFTLSDNIFVSHMVHYTTLPTCKSPRVPQSAAQATMDTCNWCKQPTSVIFCKMLFTFLYYSYPYFVCVLHITEINTYNLGIIFLTKIKSKSNLKNKLLQNKLRFLYTHKMKM